MGVALRLKDLAYRKDRLLVALLLGGIFLWYANSSWHQWWFGDAFGGRAFLELSPLFILGFAFFFKRLFAQSMRWQRSVLFLLSLCVIYTYSLMACYIGHKIPRADFFSLLDSNEEE